MLSLKKDVQSVILEVTDFFFLMWPLTEHTVVCNYPLNPGLSAKEVAVSAPCGKPGSRTSNANYQ